MGSKGSDCRRPISTPATSPSFYKIILPSTMHDHKLRLPKEFSKKHGNELSTSVTFTDRSGEVCHVGVEKADKMLWFTNGWKEFSENHSIGCGFVIVFNYEGNSKFNVVIFDLTATEIHNPRKTLSVSKEPRRGKQCPLSNKGEKGGKDLIKTWGDLPSRTTLASCGDQSRTGKRCCGSLIQNLSKFAPEFALRINERGRCLSSLESLRSNFQYLTRNKRYKMETQGKIVKVENVTLSRKSKMKASEMPKSQRSSVDKLVKEKWNRTSNVDNLAAVPFVRHCDLYNGGRLMSHIDWEDKEGQHKKSDSVFVQEPMRKKKGLHYRFNEIKHTKNAHELKSSDAANQRTDSNGQQLKVKQEEEEELLGVNDSRNISRMRPVTTQERKKAVNAAVMFETNNPCFMKILQLYNVRKSSLHVPARFAKNYLHEVSDSIQLQVSGGKQWTVHCIRVRGIVQTLTRGWNHFIKDNSLGEGDVCVFELIQVKDAVLKVSIFHAREDTSYQPGYDGDVMLYLSTELGLRQACIIKDERPSWFLQGLPAIQQFRKIGKTRQRKSETVVEPTKQGIRVLEMWQRIPSAFVARLKGRIPDKVFLRNRRGKLWPVETEVGNDFYFTAGWVKFIEDNSLEFGDFLLFEYDGNDVFYFKIFGKTACEKEVIGSSDLSVNKEEDNEEGDDDDAVEVEEYNDGNGCVVEKEELEANTLKKKTEKGKSEKSAKSLRVEEEDDDNDNDDDDMEEEEDSQNDSDEEEHEEEIDGVVEERDEEYNEVEEKDEELEANTSTKKAEKSATSLNKNRGTNYLDSNKGKAAVRVEDGGYKRTNVIKAHDEEDVFEYGMVSRPKNPYFVTRLRERRRNELYVPADVIKDHGLKLPENLIILDEEGRKWSSKVIVWKDGRTWLTGGWRAFCKWNHLKWEDRCLCEFVQEEGSQGLHLKVRILREGSWLPKGENQTEPGLGES